MPKPHAVLLAAYRAQAGKGVQITATVDQKGEQHSRSEACQECPLQRGFFGAGEGSKRPMGEPEQKVWLCTSRFWTEEKNGAIIQR